MLVGFLRPLRRLINKKFGGYKKFFLVISSLAVIIYTLKKSFFIEPQHWIPTRGHANISGNDCDVVCEPGHMSFYLKSGEGRDDGPIICFQGEVLMSKELKNVGRGLNTVLIDSRTQKVKTIRVFDTYVDDSSILRFLKGDAKEDDLVLIATFDDASAGLRESGREWLSLFGSALISKLRFRDNFIMIGQRGLEQGRAIENKMANKNSKDNPFAPVIEEAGCFTVPMGKLVSMENRFPDVLRGNSIKRGKRSDYCGLPHPCPANSVSVSVDTGVGNQRKPSICVGDYIYMDESTNGAGRGFNVVAINSVTKAVIAVTHMDTYTFDSTDLEIFLDTLHEEDIIISVIADDASKKLGQGGRDILNQMGSGMIQNLRFRDVWYFVGQKGIKGFTQLEDISFAGFDGSWPKPLMNRFCVPQAVPFSKTMVDPLVTRNDRRREFCLKNEGYTDFCNPSYVDDQLKAIPVSNKALKHHPIFEVPMVIVPGMNHNAFVNTLQTTLMQPGIQPHMVSVLWDEKLPEQGELADMFGFGNFSLDSSMTYSEQMIKALKHAHLIYPSETFIMVIEEDVLLGPDFLRFMANCLDVVSKDSSLAGAAAWNINGFEQSSGDPDVVYRVQDFPGLGFLIKTGILQQLVDSWGRCCKDRAWSGWRLDVQGLEMLVPDMSRVYRTPFYGAQAQSQVSRDLFLKPRTTYLEVQTELQNLKHLMSTEYEKFLENQIIQASSPGPAVLLSCLKGKAPPPDYKDLKEGPLVWYYEQQKPNDKELLNVLCQCFGLVVMEQTDPKNLHNGLLRFYHKSHNVFLVGTASPYYKLARSSDVITKAMLFS